LSKMWLFILFILKKWQNFFKKSLKFSLKKGPPCSKWLFFLSIQSSFNPLKPVFISFNFNINF
jgi:hypothetical protein